MLTFPTLIIWLITGILLIITVLLHSPKGDGMGGMAVGAAASMFSSTRSAESTLNRVTWTLVTIFLLLAVLLSAGWLELGNSGQAVSPRVITPETSEEVDLMDVEPALPTDLPVPAEEVP